MQKLLKLNEQSLKIRKKISLYKHKERLPSLKPLILQPLMRIVKTSKKWLCLIFLIEVFVS